MDYRELLNTARRLTDDAYASDLYTNKHRNLLLLRAISLQGQANALMLEKIAIELEQLRLSGKNS